jgi:predicted ArsR family transcriptional regulator
VQPPGLEERADAPTRQRVARTILEHGPLTTAALAEHLSVTPAAVRRHLDHMLAEGTVEVREPIAHRARGRGRPARLFALTEAGRDQFEQQYDDLAAQALRFLAQTGGEQAITDFARQRLAWVEDAVTTLRERRPDLSASQALAQVLHGAGFAASVHQVPVGEQLCQQHCPVSHVAHEFPQLCEVETEVFSRVLGSHVQRLATIAHGDGVCTTCIPTAISTADPTTGPTTAPTTAPTTRTTPEATTSPTPTTERRSR